MTVLGRVESLWRYPVKSMAGEAVERVFAGFAGVYGDRLYAVKKSSGPAGFPFLTARDKAEVIRYRPRFRNPDQAVMPPNWLAAEALGPGLTPLYDDGTDLTLEVETPSGAVLAIDDPALLASLSQGLTSEPSLSMVRSDRALTDCRPLSVFPLATARALSAEVGMTLDTRRFRANVCADLTLPGFAENELVGRQIRIGPKVVVAVLGRDPRCQMITLDPDTGAASPEILRAVARNHGGDAGLYAAMLVEGMIGRGDEIVLL